MSDEDMYESLGDGVSIGVSMAAGAMAGIAEHCLMFPVDSVKTRMQALACEKQIRSTGIFTSILKIIKEEGARRPFQGVQVMALGAGPAHALHFSCYEQLKTRLSQLKVLPESAVYGIAGGAATLFHDAIMTPAEAVKQRVQMCCSPYKNCRTCVRVVLRQEGIRAFYRSYTTQLAMNIPFQSTLFLAYEGAQNLTNEAREYNPTTHIISGAAAGAVAATVTMPLDVCKTLLNTQEPSLVAKLQQGRIIGMFGAARTVYAVAGLPGFFYGLKARVLYQMPATAITWVVYETFKYVLNEHSKESSNNHTYDTLKTTRQQMQTAAASDRGTLLGSEASSGDTNVTSTKLWETIADISPASRGTPGRLHAASEAWNTGHTGAGGTSTPGGVAGGHQAVGGSTTNVHESLTDSSSTAALGYATSLAHHTRHSDAATTSSFRLITAGSSSAGSSAVGSTLRRGD